MYLRQNISKLLTNYLISITTLSVA